jgi:hypothetical protein
MKTIALTMVAWLMVAVVCYGQDSAMWNTMQALERQKSQAETYERCLEAGRALFGADERWTKTKKGAFAGTLLGKEPPDFQIGDWGCTTAQFKVLNKISNTECLVLARTENPAAMLLRGLDMSKVTDGAQFVLQHPVVIQATYSYTAVSGSKKTVVVLAANDTKLAEVTAKIRAAAEAERLAEKAKQDAIQAAKQRIEDAKRRTWTSGNGKFTVDAKFISMIGGIALLEKNDGQHINVNLDELSQADQDFIKERRWLEYAESGLSDASTNTAMLRFVGRWHAIDDYGKITQYVTLSSDQTAKRDHVPNILGKWEIVGEEVHITFDDGWLGLLRQDRGNILIESYKPGSKWGQLPATPLHTQRFVKGSQKK